MIGLAREIHYPAIDSRLAGPEFYHPYTVVPTPMQGFYFSKLTTAEQFADLLRTHAPPPHA